MTNHNDLKPHQYYNPTDPHITMQSPILILTPNTKIKEEIWQRIQDGMDDHKCCYLKFFNHDEIERMIEDGISLEETISRADLADLAEYQETDRYIYTIIYDPEEQALIHLQMTEDFTITGKHYLTRYNLTELCEASTDEHVIGMQMRATDHRTPKEHKKSTHRNNLHNRFTEIKGRPKPVQTTNTTTLITKENADLQKKIKGITRENEIIKRGLDNRDPRKVMYTNQQEENGVSCLTHPPSWLTPPTTPERDETPQSPTMEQKGEEKATRPNVETDEEDEGEYQRNLEEVRANRQHERAKEDIWNKILQQNQAFQDHCNTGSWALHERYEHNHRNPQRRLSDHIKTQWQRLTTLREKQEDPHENNDMIDGEFIIDTMKASRKQFPEFYKAYETHRLKDLQWSIQTMRLHAKEFRLTIEGYEELCKREHSAMIIKNARPDPVEFKSTIQHWISEIFNEYETFTDTATASQYAIDAETETSLEDPDDWQEALTDDTFIELIIEKLRPHIPTMVTMYDIDLYKGQPWNIDTL
jgi:hypothetical protein